MPRRVSLRPPVTPKKVSKVFCRLMSGLDRPVRNCNYGDHLVLETCRRRYGSQPSPGVGSTPIHEYFQVVVRFEQAALTVRAQRIVSRPGSPISREDCTTAFVFPLAEGRAIAKTARKLLAIVRRPDLILPGEGSEFARTGRAGRCEPPTSARHLAGAGPRHLAT